jgi:hypothetical protein
MTIRILLTLILLVSVAQAGDMLTLKDLQSAFHAMVNNATIADSVSTLYVNAGMHQVAEDLRCLPKKDTIVSSDGNSDYALNSDFLLGGVNHIELKSEGMRYGMVQVPPSEIGKLGDETGCPQTFYTYGEKLTVYPEGTAQACTMIVTYEAEPSYITSAADECDLPQISHRWLAVQYAAFLYYDANQRDQDATAMLTKYLEAIKRKRQDVSPSATVITTEEPGN